MKDIKSFKIVWNKMMLLLSRNQKILGIFVFILSLISAGVELLGVSVILPLLNALLQPRELINNKYINKICSFFSVNDDWEILVAVIVMVIIVYVVKNIYLMFFTWFRIKYAMKIEREISIAAIQSYMKQGYYYFRTHNTAIIMRGTTSAASGIEIIIESFFYLLSDVLTAISIFAYLFMTDLKLTLIIVLIAGIAIFVIINGARKYVRKLSGIAYEKTAAVNQCLLHICYGIKEILVMNKREFFINNFEKNYIEEQQAGTKQNLVQQYPRYLIEIVCVVTLMITVMIRCRTVDDMISFVPQLGIFAVAAFRVMPIVGNLSARVNGILFKLPCVDELYENLSSTDSTNGLYIKQDDELAEKIFSSSLDIDNIVYNYPDSKEKVLNGISISIKKGESIALVGHSGAGKSTLADLILGLYEPSRGSITMDGINILEHKDMWANNIGFVPQSVYLLDDTVKKNVAFGTPDENIDEERIWDVLNRAQLKSFVEGLPKGLETRIGERGVRFSGGQAQRLAIARALYNNPQIIVFDEATSALDNETENAVMEAIDALQGEKTLIIIAHRITTVKNCEHIYRIENGKAVEVRYEDLQ